MNHATTWCRVLIRALLLAPVILRAQTSTLSLDVGSSRTRFADSIDATAVSLTPAFRIAAPRASLSASGTLSRFAGASSNSGSLNASLFTPSRGIMSAELQATAGGSAHSDGARTGQMLGMGRLHLATRDRGAWVGAGLGRTWDGAWRGVRQGDAGGWFTTESNTFSVSVSPTVVDDTIKYADAFLSAHREFHAWELGGSLGFRAGDQIPTLPANRTAWGHVGATYWFRPRVGFTVGVGSYPVDFTQGFPGGQYVSVSLRLRSVTRPGSDDPPQSVAPAGIVRFSATTVSGDFRRIRVDAPNACSVELTGDFTGWTPVALASNGSGVWTVTLPVERGTHEVNVRIDGGAWQVPPGLTPLKDEFGGTVGLLVIP